MSYLNHNLPDWSCYIRNEFLYNHEKGQGGTFNRISENPGYEIDTTVYSVENTRSFETSNHYIYDIKEVV
jgi:hypothetical protein